MRVHGAGLAIQANHLRLHRLVLLGHLGQVTQDQRSLARRELTGLLPTQLDISNQILPDEGVAGQGQRGALGLGYLLQQGSPGLSCLPGAVQAVLLDAGQLGPEGHPLPRILGIFQVVFQLLAQALQAASAPEQPRHVGAHVPLVRPGGEVSLVQPEPQLGGLRLQVLSRQSHGLVQRLISRHHVLLGGGPVAQLLDKLVPAAGPAQQPDQLLEAHARDIL